MASMPSDFWSGWIAVITSISLIGLAWLVFSIYFSPKAHEDFPTVWDENLRKGSNPAPMWWFWLILMSMVFSVAYLMLYPGMGSYKGALKWSQGGRLGESYALHDYEFLTLRQQLLESPIEALQSDEAVMRSAKGIFSRNCAACHGPAGLGQANLFPNLMDDAWQWGGDLEQIEQTVRAGRQATMPAWGPALGEDGVKNVADYVTNISTAGQDHAGAVQYQQFCMACHGPEGKGNVLLGAPDLTDADWLYGGDPAQISHSINLGRSGVMPAFGDRLDDVQIRMLMAWLSRNSARNPD
jgi:cytochrome c oxidase cbb3-type subunit 3